MRHRQLATLHFLHRSLLTSPSQKRVLPMPHFSFWSWPLPFIGSIPSASKRIAAIEREVKFAEKDERAVWRGTQWFNNGAGMSPRGRQELLVKTKEKAWADVQALEWTANSEDASNALRIEDFCRRKYIIHTEGFGYSGRLQFHQLCASVVISPPLEWMQHTSHLIRPVFSTTLLGHSYPKGKEEGVPKWEERARRGWKDVYTAGKANMVFVRPDWEDLEAVVAWLEENEDVARGIAERQREMFVGRGYLSPAAEACYWRAMIRGWAEIARPVGEGWDVKGVPYEEFVAGKQDGREVIVGN